VLIPCKSPNPNTHGPHTSKEVLLDARRVATLTLVALTLVALFTTESVACPLHHRKRVCRAALRAALFTTESFRFAESELPGLLLRPQRGEVSQWATFSATQVLEGFPASTRGLGFFDADLGSGGVRCWFQRFLMYTLYPERVCVQNPSWNAVTCPMRIPFSRFLPRSSVQGGLM